MGGREGGGGGGGSTIGYSSGIISALFSGSVSVGVDKKKRLTKLNASGNSALLYSVAAGL